MEGRNVSLTKPVAEPSEARDDRLVVDRVADPHHETADDRRIDDERGPQGDRERPLHVGGDLRLLGGFERLGGRELRLVKARLLVSGSGRGGRHAAGQRQHVEIWGDRKRAGLIIQDPSIGHTDPQMGKSARVGVYLVGGNS